jgi:hypothetical protein
VTRWEANVNRTDDDKVVTDFVTSGRVEHLDRSHSELRPTFSIQITVAGYTMAAARLARA